MRNITEKKKPKTNNYLHKYKEFLSIEGGLSNEHTDRYKCKVKYHTNKGVRYTTFKRIHKTATYSDFLLMNDSMYVEVIKYHERVVNRLISYDTNNIQIKLFLIEELWACGNLDTYKNVDMQDSNILDRLYILKERRYAEVLNSNPHLLRYKKGWKRRREEFLTFNNQFN